MTHRRVIVALAATLLAAAAPPVAAQDPRLAAITDPGARAAIHAIVVDAERRGLSREPLVSKALEGVEKGAPPARIEAAVRTMVGRLTIARTLLSPVATSGEQRAVVDALYAGVPAEAIRVVSAVAGGRPSPVALGVLADLVTRGVPSARAAEAVAGLVGRGARTPQLIALRRDVQEDVAAGVPAARALDLRERSLIATLAVPVPAQAEALTNVPNVPASRP